jgi:hypothetical protein
MSTAGYGMKWGKGYRTGAKEPDVADSAAGEVHEEEPNEEEGDPTAMIHEHLTKMHEMTGKAHSHVEHHGDGTHTSHHVDEQGQVSGPHEHESMEALHQHMAQLHGEGEQEGEMKHGAY